MHTLLRKRLLPLRYQTLSRRPLDQTSEPKFTPPTQLDLHEFSELRYIISYDMA
ncbi:hypothetical protein EJ03DRAFT_332405 [Teratosphaeria nubilosa]|uniref:Uncharacterized protein n=1 Tax=Teratosphaeria nubilosa TaxID=161662 RepID=A0A6G1KT26_9PEZI|nr:hypothetical protein EJ03DRAFT_332405 [Teratosphaeria nubilosa]